MYRKYFQRNWLVLSTTSLYWYQLGNRKVHEEIIDRNTFLMLFLMDKLDETFTASCRGFDFLHSKWNIKEHCVGKQHDLLAHWLLVGFPFILFASVQFGKANSVHATGCFCLYVYECGEWWSLFSLSFGIHTLCH